MPAVSPRTGSADFTAALIRRDTDAALEPLADDVVFFYRVGAVLVGKVAFATAMSANWQVVEQSQSAAADPVWISRLTPQRPSSKGSHDPAWRAARA